MYLPGFDDHRRSAPTRSGQLSFVEVGSGPAALFVHGLATNAYIWHNLLPLLAEGRRCIAVDLPLHGQSQALPDLPLTIGGFTDAVLELCAHLDLERIDLVGHDTGGAIAQVLAARRPELIRTLTLTNCETQDNIPPAAMAATIEAARAGQLAKTAPSVLADPAAARAFFTIGYQDPQFLSQELVDAFLEPVLGTPAAALRFQDLIANLGPDELVAAAPTLRTLRAPTLIAWATEDEFFDLKWAQWLHDTIPGSREIVEITGGKLFFPHERAPELARHIHRHWAGSDPA